MLLNDVRDFIATLGVAEDEHCYSHELADKKNKSIGIYNLKSSRSPIRTIGGKDNASYGVKGVSLLVHWTTLPNETEKAAMSLYDSLEKTRNVTINGQTIKFIQMSASEPIDMSTDEYGIYEYVIECLIYYERKV